MFDVGEITCAGVANDNIGTCVDHLLHSHMSQDGAHFGVGVVCVGTVY